MNYHPQYNNFISADRSYKESEVVIIGLPFDSTSSFRPGSRFAPNQIRTISYNLETYSPYLERDLESIAITDYGDLELPFGNVMKTIEVIEETASKLINDDKKVVYIGGEHTITYPIIKAYKKKLGNLKVIQFDAHCDLREDYLGDRFSHATVMRLIVEEIGEKNIFQLGIRSGTKDEFEYMKKLASLYHFSKDSITKLLSNIKDDDNIYITVDMDVFDPSNAPGVGTPEAGGIDFAQFIEVIKMLDVNVVGFDIVELAPDYDMSKISTALATKIIREMILKFYY